MIERICTVESGVYVFILVFRCNDVIVVRYSTLNKLCG